MLDEQNVIAIVQMQQCIYWLEKVIYNFFIN